MTQSTNPAMRRDDIAFATLVIHKIDGTALSIDVDGEQSRILIDMDYPTDADNDLIGMADEMKTSPIRAQRLEINLVASLRPGKDRLFTMDSGKSGAQHD